MTQDELRERQKTDMLDVIKWDGGGPDVLEELRNWGTGPIEALVNAAVDFYDGKGDERMHWALCEMAQDKAKRLNDTIVRLIYEAGEQRKAEREAKAATQI